MEVKVFLNSGAELRAFAKFAAELAPIRDAQIERDRKDYFVFEDAPAAPAVDPAQTELPLTTEPVADVTEPAPVKKERKPRQKKQPEPEPVIDAEPIAQDAPKQAEVTVDVDLPEPTPAPAPAAPVVAGPKAEDLANQTRDLAKVNFAGVKGVLAKFGVARFGELKPEQYPQYAAALAAL